MHLNELHVHIICNAVI